MQESKTPYGVGAAARYPYSPKLAKKYTFPSKYEDGETIEAFRVHGDQIWLPRNVAPTGSISEVDPGDYCHFEKNWKARSHEQQRVIDDTCHYAVNGHSFITQAPTGFGKTLVGCAAAQALGRRTLVITTKEDIIKQWSDSAKTFLGLKDHEIGVWRADQVPLKSHKFVIGLVHSIAKGPERYGLQAYLDFGLVICDEVHRMGAQTFSQAMWWLPAKIRLGLSATPYRKDGRDVLFNMHIGDVRVTAEMEVMIPKVIVQFSKWKLPRDRYGQKLHVSPGKTMHLNRYFGSDLRRNTLICNFLRAAMDKNRSTIVFADTMDHLHNIRAALLSFNVPEKAIGYYVGLQFYKGLKMSKDAKLAEREAAKRRPIILATYQMASEATDIPWLDTCILASPRSDVVQIVGRIRREYPNKKTPVVFDIVDKDCAVFAAYAGKRQQWYKSLGCEVI